MAITGGQLKAARELIGLSELLLAGTINLAGRYVGTPTQR
jgi:hypothetical protein